MSVAFSTHSLKFEGFTLDFEVSVEQSIQETRAFAGAPPEFIYVSGQVTVGVAGDRHVVIDPFNAGNLLELLRSMQERIAKLPSCDAISTLVGPGRVCAVLRQYWLKIDNDEAQPEDELQYDLLSPLILSEGRSGRICFYQCGGVGVIEVSCWMKPHAFESVVDLTSTFEPSDLAAEVDLVVKSAREAVRSALA